MRNPDHIRAAAEEYADKHARFEADGLVDHRPRALLIAEWERDYLHPEPTFDEEAEYERRHGHEPEWRR